MPRSSLWKHPLSPGDLPDGVALLGSLETRIFQDGTLLDELPQGAEITVAFEIPDGVDPADLQILFWDGSAWVAIDGQSTEDGFFEALAEHGGVFILVQN